LPPQLPGANPALAADTVVPVGFVPAVADAFVLADALATAVAEDEGTPAPSSSSSSSLVATDAEADGAALVVAATLADALEAPPPPSVFF
jgi:hypothetical protein